GRRTNNTTDAVGARATNLHGPERPPWSISFARRLRATSIHLTDMHSYPSLHALLDDVARRREDAVAVDDPPDGMITYADLRSLSDRVRDRLVAMGVRPSDRVGFYLRKSIDAVAGIFGAMKAGAAYVPVDPNAPA